MRRLLIVLVSSLVLGLAAGVGTALAGTPGEPGLPLQSATQSNEGTNTANQSGTSAPVVVSGPNIAVANGGSDVKSSCNPCGGNSGGTVNQNSGNTVDASVVNAANQTNNQSNDLGQSQTVAGDNNGCCREAGKGSSASQSAEQTNQGTNKAEQSGISAPIVVSGPNIAALNSRDVNQNSGNTVDASTANYANQTNNQSNSAGQSQTVVADGQGCCSKHGDSSGPTQTAEQSNEGTNKAEQFGISAPIVVSGPNIAALNKGDVNQNSGNSVDASTANYANQKNNQSNDLDQHQKVAGRDGNCCSKGGTEATQTAEQSNEGTNEAKQSGISAPIVVSGPNVAIANGWGHDKCNPCGDDRGSVDQNSGNTVDASTANYANQKNNQSNDLDQHQKVWGGDGNCCSKDGGSGATQTADQSNEGTNKAEQSGISAPIVVSGPNIAALNKGDVNQNSGNTVDASVTNSAQQTNNQSNDLDQHQKVRGGNGCQPRCKPECKPRCEPRPCQPKCD